MRALLLVPAVVALVVAPAAAELGTFALWPEGGAHDHANAAHHAGLSHGLQQLAQVQVRAGTTGEVDALGNLAVAAHWSGGAGLTTIDITDPAIPVKLGSLSLGTGTGTDLKVFRGALGGTRAILSVQGGLPSTNALGATGLGINLLSLDNPAQPLFLSSLTTPGAGVHMLDVATILGVPYVFAVNQIPDYEVIIAAVVGDAVLVPVGAIVPDNPYLSIHDVTVRFDAASGKWLAIVAGWDQGVEVFDVTVPAAPLPLGEWDPAEADNIHTVMPVTIEGRRLIVAAPEYLNTVHILDATDLGNIVKIGSWRFPDNKPTGSARWSTHDFNIRDGKVYLAHYHGGALVLRLESLADAANPPILANLLPQGAKYASGDGPLTWDVYPADNGAVLLGDITMGFFTARLT